MTPKERQLATIRHGLTDRVSADVMYIYNAPDLAEILQTSTRGVWHALGIDGFPILLEYRNELAERDTDPNRTTWSTMLIDDASSHYGTVRTYPLAGASSIDDLHDFEWPDPDQFGFERATGLVKSLGETHALRGPLWVPVFCKACDLFGMEEAMIRMMVDPELFAAALDMITDVHVATCERYLEECGELLPIFACGDDFATQRGLMIAPEQWRQFIRPRLQRIIDVGRKHDKIIWFHSCGDVTAVLPDLIEMGVQVWETVQLHTLPISPRELKQQFGEHLTFFGGINTQRLPFVEPADIATEVIDRIEALGEGGGYICGPDHTINHDVPPENTIALYETVTSFRRKGYTLM